jgi:hypothetical protein
VLIGAGRVRPSRVENSLGVYASGVVPKPGVGDQIVVGAGAELGASLNAFAKEAGLLQRSLLGQVFDVGRSLDSVGIGRLE